MTRWQIIKVLLIVAYRVLVKRDYLGLLRDLVPVAPTETSPLKHHPAAMKFSPELRKMVRGGGVQLLAVILLAGSAIAAGQITVTGFPPVPVTIKGGDGISIAGGVITATGVPAGGVSDITFKNYTTGQKALNAAQDAAISAAAGVAGSALQPGDVDNEVYATAYNGGALTSATINTALTAIGSTVKTLVLTPGVWVQSADVTIPANVTLRMHPGAKISWSAGYLTINGPVDLPRQTVFQGFAPYKLVWGNRVGEIYIDWCAAVGDGVTNDRAEILGLINRAYAKTEIVFSERSYLVSTPILLDAYLDARINLNGATIIAPGGFIVSGYYANDYTGLSFSITANNPSFTIPGGASIAVGDLINIIAASAYQPSAADSLSYKRGVLGRVVSITGGAATLDTIPLHSFTSDRIIKFGNAKSFQMWGGTLDLSSATDGTASGVTVTADNVTIHDLKITGSSLAGFGLNLFGNNVHVYNNRISDFLCLNGAAGGRYGDGIAIIGTNINVHNNFLWGNKHNASFAASGVTSNNVAFWNNTLWQYPNHYGELSPVGDSYWGGSFDVHGNAEHIEVYGNTIISSGKYIVNLRNSRGNYHNNNMKLISTAGATAIFGIAYDETLADLKLSDNNITSAVEVALADEDSDYIHINSGNFTNVTWKGGLLEDGKYFGLLRETAIDGTVYGAGWDGDTSHAPDKNAVYDKIEAVVASIAEAGGGTVTSAGLSLPAEFSVTGSPVTTSGTLAAAWADQSTGKAFMSPNGSTGAPSFRAIAAADFGTTMAPQFGTLGVNAANDASAKVYVWGSTGTAIRGNSGTGGYGVKGDTTTGVGVSGISNSSGTGVFGSSDSGFGFNSTSNSGSGIKAASSTGIAVEGSGGFGTGAKIYQFKTSGGMTQSNNNPTAWVQKNMDITAGSFTASGPTLLVENSIATADVDYGPLIQAKKGSTVVFQVNEDGSASHSGALTIGGTINNPALIGTTSTTIDTATNGYADVSSAGATALTVTNVVAGRVFTIKVTSSGGGAISFVTLTPTWEGSAPASVTATKSTRIVCLGTGANAAMCSVAKENF